MIWAYSNTSLNLVPALFFLLLGYLFFKKYQRLHQNRFLIFSSAFLGFGFLIRTDIILFIIPIWAFLLISHLSAKKKIFSISLFSIPSLICYYIYKIIPGFRFNLEEGNKELSLYDEDACEPGLDCQNDNISVSADISNFSSSIFDTNLFEVCLRIFGILFAPGVGLFIFCPILLTVFFSFYDFFRKNKADCLLILSFLILNIIYHCLGTGGWHGLNAWGARYLLLVIPFLLIPLVL